MPVHRAVVPALLAFLLVAAALYACGSDKTDAGVSAPASVAPTATASAPTPLPAATPTPPPATPTAQPTAQALPTETAAPAPTPIQALSDAFYDPTLAMYAKFPGLDRGFEMTAPAFESIRRNNDVSQVPVLIDLLMLLPLDSRDDVETLLHHLTGQQIPGGDWHAWAEWLGRNKEDYPPPEGYAAWKRSLFSAIDPRFSMLLRSAETALIDLTELAWGGVPPDGIPDLREPAALSAGEATFLADDERVFGLSINGQHRAYPLRTINPHEMVNDTLGGEPVALSW